MSEFHEENIGAEVHENTEAPSGPPIESEPVAEPTAQFRFTDDPSDMPVSPPQTDDVFNPDIHCVDENGNPKRTKAGKYRLKPGAKYRVNAAAQAAAEATRVDPFNEPPPLSTVQLVETITSVAFIMLSRSLGDEWIPTPEEKKMLVDVYSRYCHYRGWDMEATPELVLFGVTLAYLMPRIMTPKFMQRFLRRKNVDAHSNNRPNTNGQDDAGKNHGSTNGTGGATGDSIRPPFEQLG